MNEIINCQSYRVHVGDQWSHFNLLLEERYSKVFVLVDQNTEELCLPYLKEKVDRECDLISIEAGEKFKNLDTCKNLWTDLLNKKADRKSLLINLGGGVIGDMGGFVASTFMRGIDFIQVPTTLLSQVDASVGSKLAVDHNSFKNVVGLFNSPVAVFVDPAFLKTLDPLEFRSGKAEMIKHGLISDQTFWKQLIETETFEEWCQAIPRAIEIKKEVVEEDPLESGYRKILNFGHTIGHAVESVQLLDQNELKHGDAIAIGMICESYISFLKNYISKQHLDQIVSFILDVFGHHPSLTADHSRLLQFISRDKKNEHSKLMFSLLKDIGECQYNENVEEVEIIKALTYYKNI